MISCIIKKKLRIRQNALFKVTMVCSSAQGCVQIIILHPDFTFIPRLTTSHWSCFHLSLLELYRPLCLPLFPLFPGTGSVSWFHGLRCPADGQICDIKIYLYIQAVHHLKCYNSSVNSKPSSIQNLLNRRLDLNFTTFEPYIKCLCNPPFL